MRSISKPSFDLDSLSVLHGKGGIFSGLGILVVAKKGKSQTDVSAAPPFPLPRARAELRHSVHPPSALNPRRCRSNQDSLRPFDRGGRLSSRIRPRHLGGLDEEAIVYVDSPWSRQHDLAKAVLDRWEEALGFGDEGGGGLTDSEQLVCCTFVAW